MEPITTLFELQRAVAALRPVAAGKVRVFRGQTTDHPTISPASFRTHLASRSAWSIYSRFLLSDIAPDGTERRLASEELRVQALWLEAIAQHYGNGSSYLDVTHSLESAAWFALHRGKFVTERHQVGAGAPAWLAQAAYEEKWLEYSPATEPGYIYAFDVEDWDGGLGAPPPLTLVDLSRAPAPLQTPRMLAQLGCVIRTLETEGFDLKRHCVSVLPIQVAWPLAGSEFVQRSVEEIFPAPSIDAWYRRLLNVPMVPDFDQEHGEVFLRRALPVTLYRAETSAYNAELVGTEGFLDPPLLHERLHSGEFKFQALESSKEQEMRKSVAEALPIILEAPVLRIFPAADSTLWNHDLLMSDLPEPLAEDAGDQKEPAAATLSIANVVFQFSALEETNWGVVSWPRRLVRGLWLEQQGEEFAAALITQNLPDTMIDLEPMVLFRYAPNLRRLIYRRPGEVKVWRLMSSLPELAKCIFVALYLLRCLNPRWKVEATPLRYVLGDPIPQVETNFFYPSIFADEARLTRVKGPAGVADWFVLRNKLNDPFTTAPKAMPAMSIQTAAAFADFPIKTFREYIAANQAGLDESAKSSASKA